ncbi:hypothetical protein ACFWDI_35745 [Streptomyces sp. NPDC060064]|uniref:hypothetical protein n=1 Tax=Streptomyces sp. NPDC060064 TaxID=3347049 RepID=UPI00368A9348
MSDHTKHLENAMRAFNEAERAEFTATNNLTWLGLDGPTYLLGDVRAKAFYTGADGRHWVDAYLVVESLSGLVTNAGHLEGYRQLAAEMDEGDDLWVCTETRGKWNAVMTPIDTLARAWGYPPPALMPTGNWARTWLDMPERTDQMELAWIAHGGKPIHTYRLGDTL